MVYPNEAPRLYQFRGIAAMGHTHTDGSIPLCGGVRLDIGFGGEPSIIDVYAVSVYDLSDVVGRYKLYLQSTDLALSHTTTGSGWNDDLAFRIEMDDVELATDCDEWTFGCGDIRLYFDLGGGGESLVYTKSGPHSLNGNGYDPRNNAVVATSIHHLGDENAVVEVLPAHPNDEDDTEHAVQNDVTVGWKYDAVEPGASIDESQVPPDVGCDDCDRTLRDVTLEAITPDTWLVQWSGEVKYDRDRSDLGNFNFYCCIQDTTIGVPGVRNTFRVDLTYYRDLVTVDLNPDDAGLLSSIKTACAKCDVDPEVPYDCNGPTAQVDSVTNMAFQKSVQSLVAHTHYHHFVSAAICPPDDPTGVRCSPGFAPGAPQGSDLCWYEANGSYTHQQPACAGIGWLSYHRLAPWRHFLLYGDLSDNVFIARSDSGEQFSWSSTGHAIVATAGCIRKTPLGLYVYTVEAGVVKERFSTDEGQTLGSPTTIGDGTQVTAYVTPQGLRYIYRREADSDLVAQVRDEAGNVLVSDTVITTGVAADAPLSIVVDQLQGGEQRWRLSWIQAGNMRSNVMRDGVFQPAAAEIIGAGTHVADCLGPDRLRYIYRRTSAGAIVAQIRDAGNNVVKADATAVASGVDADPIDAEVRPLVGGRLQIALHFLSSGAHVVLFSTDGFTFN